ncbi:MAG: hypothetical protein JWP55_4875 [Mycobacterium sp.]|nr:hypothetical protein [Mycobacterium sp.]
MIPVALLVVAKAPVPGLAKTRLAATVGDAAAADFAAASLLDTLDAVADAPVAARVVALTGDLAAASRRAELEARLSEFTVIEQRGAGFADRLANAHADASRTAGGVPVLQIGMDTPQVTPGLLADCATTLCGADAVLGLACDGGWWILGVTHPDMAECLRTVPMSQPDTGAVTLRALGDTGRDVRLVPELADVDTFDDIAVVGRACLQGSRFHQLCSVEGA